MKKILLTLVFLSFAGFGLAFYYWKQFTNLPDWYTHQTENSPKIVDIRNEQAVSEAKTRLERKIEASLVVRENPPVAEAADNSDSPFDSRPIIESASKPRQPDGRNVEISLNEKEFSELVISNLVEKIGDRQLLESAEGFNATIKDGAVEAGVVLNVSALRSRDLAEPEKDTIDQAIQTFPFLENRSVYLAIEGKPTVKNGQLLFDETTKIKVGNVSLTLSEAAQKLGMSRKELEEKISLELQVGRVQVNEINFVGDRALIRGSVKENL